MNIISVPQEMGIRKKKGGTWVQTERSAHEAWAKFSIRKPTASAVLHRLIAQMGQQNAVVIPQKVLAQVLGVTDRTIRKAISDLAAERWIQVVRIGKGKEAAYVVNDRVAWAQPRDRLRLSIFSAAIVANYDDQDNATLDDVGLRKLPVMYPGENQLPTGKGEPPPVQPAINGLEPDLPCLKK